MKKPRKHKKVKPNEENPLEALALASSRAVRTQLKAHFLASVMLGFGAIITACAIGGLFYTLHLISVSHTLRLQGRLQAIEQSTPIKHDLGGVVKNLLVTEGEIVREGQILVSLGTSDLEEAREEARKSVARLLIRSACLKALRKGEAQLSLNDTLRSVAARLEQTDFMRRVVMKCQAELEVSAFRKSRDTSELAALTDQVNLTGRLSNTSSSVQRRLLDIPTNMVEGSVELRELLDLNSMARALQHAVAAAEIDQTLSKRRAAIRLKDIKRLGDIDQELSLISDQLLEAEQSLARMDKQINQRFIFASTSGRVQRIRIRKAGGRVAAGAYVMEIAPLTTDFEVLSTVSIAEIPDISVGMPVNVQLSGGMPRPVWVPAQVAEIAKTSATHRLVRIRLTRQDLNKRDLLRGDHTLNGLGEQSEAVISIASENAVKSLAKIMQRQWVGAPSDEV